MSYEIFDITEGNKVKMTSDIIQLIEPYDPKKTQIDTFIVHDAARPSTRNTRIFKIDEVGMRDTYFLFYVNESMYVVINNDQQFQLDLKPAISDLIGYFKGKDLY